MKILKRTVFITVTIIEIILYLSFMIIDISNIDFDESYIKYSALLILLPFLLINIKCWDLNHILYRVAFITTVMADLFLLILGEYYEIGLIFFITTQCCYFISQLYDKNKKYWLIVLLSYILCVLILFVVLFSIDYLNILNTLVAVYFVMLITNTVISIINNRLYKSSFWLALGLILFIGCDINVGLNNMYIDSTLAQHIIFISMFMFYVPSQYFIFSSLDMLKNKRDMD